MAETLHRFTLNLKLDSEKQIFVREFFTKNTTEKGPTGYYFTLETLKNKVLSDIKCQEVLGLRDKQKDENSSRR